MYENKSRTPTAAVMTAMIDYGMISCMSSGFSSTFVTFTSVALPLETIGLSMRLSSF